MYFDFEDYRPDIQPVGRVISWREGVLLSIIAHLVAVIVLLLAPRYFPYHPRSTPAPLLANRDDPTRFVFVQPRIDRRALRPPDRGPASDQDRLAQTPERRNPANPLPFSRGNTPERVEKVPDVAGGEGPKPNSQEKAQEDRQADADGKAAAAVTLPESPSALRLPSETGLGGRVKAPGGLGDAIRNVQRYVQRDLFDNPQGGGGQFGLEGLQFDTKGVEFGPWVRRFLAQVKRNWQSIIPLSAMMLKGHVVITFNVHKDGSLTDVSVIGPCPIEPFNTAAKGALIASNPTQPLPPEYPTERAFFTVTFYYNEVPPQ